MPSSRALVVASPSSRRRRSARLQRPPFLGQVAAPVGGHPVGQLGGALGPGAAGRATRPARRRAGRHERQRPGAGRDQVGQQLGGLGTGRRSPPPGRRASPRPGSAAAVPRAGRTARPAGRRPRSPPRPRPRSAAGRWPRVRPRWPRPARTPGRSRSAGPAAATDAGPPRRASRRPPGSGGIRRSPRTAGCAGTATSARGRAAGRGATCPDWSGRAGRAPRAQRRSSGGVSPSVAAPGTRASRSGHRGS